MLSPARIAGLAGLAAAALCGSAASAQPTPEGEAPTVQAAPDVVALVPPRIKDRGTLLVATMAKYQPFSYVADGRMTGVLPEMATAVAQTMGLKAEIAQMDFPAILLSLQSNRYDIGMGEFFVRKDRLEVADFVTEWSNYDAFIVNKGGKYKPQSLGDTCGHKIAILAGSSGVPSMEAAKKKCEAANGAPPQVSSFPNMSDAVLALSSNRVEAVLTGREVGITLLTAEQPFEASGRGTGGPCATAIARNDDAKAMAEAVKAAYEHLIKDGTYARIHKRWGTDYGMIDDPTIYRQGDTPPNYSN